MMPPPAPTAITKPRCETEIGKSASLCRSFRLPGARFALAFCVLYDGPWLDEKQVPVKVRVCGAQAHGCDTFTFTVRSPPYGSASLNVVVLQTDSTRESCLFTFCGGFSDGDTGMSAESSPSPTEIFQFSVTFAGPAPTEAGCALK